MGFISLKSEPPTVVFSGDHTIEDPFLHGFLKEQGQARYEESFPTGPRSVRHVSSAAGRLSPAAPLAASAPHV